MTTFFTSMLSWLLYPADCLGASGQSFTIYVSGSEANCAPFSAPAVAATLPSILVATVFVVFSLTTTFLQFEVNPLSQASL